MQTKWGTYHWLCECQIFKICRWKITELQADSDRLVVELNVQKSDQDWGQLARARLQEEVDELRALIDAKIGEETQNQSREESKEQELVDLWSQVARLQADLSKARKLGLESQSKLKVELDNSVRAHNSLRETYKSLSEQEQASQARLAKAEGDLSDLQKAKRSLESELQSVRSRQIDADGHLGEAIRAKGVSLEIHLSNSILTITAGIRASIHSCANEMPGLRRHNVAVGMREISTQLAVRGQS